MARADDGLHIVFPEDEAGIVRADRAHPAAGAVEQDAELPRQDEVAPGAVLEPCARETAAGIAIGRVWRVWRGDSKLPVQAEELVGVAPVQPTGAGIGDFFEEVVGSMEQAQTSAGLESDKHVVTGRPQPARGVTAGLVS